MVLYDVFIIKPQKEIRWIQFVLSFCMGYLSPCLIVVQVHQPAGVFLDLPGVYKASRELHTVLNIS